MTPNPFNLFLTRRHFFGRTATGIGAAALASLLNPAASIGNSQSAIGNAQFPPRAKRVISLFMSGGPSHIDLFDYKPQLQKFHGTELPQSIRNGQRVTGMTSGQKSFPCVAPMFKFAQHGKSGTWVSELLPHIASVIDDFTVMKSV